jgi:hypothetical protein
MPDFLAGQTLTALHFTPGVADTQSDSFSFDGTTYGVDADSGTYNDCGAAFVAPNSGRVLIHWAGRLDNSGANSTSISPVVREGTSVGSGTSVLAADLNNSVLNIGTDERRIGASYLLEGLTPGDDYNVRLEHRVSAGTGTIQGRHVAVVPVS